MLLLCIGASRGFAFVEFNATEEAMRWMEMKQVETSVNPQSRRAIIARVPSTPRGDRAQITQSAGPASALAALLHKGHIHLSYLYIRKNKQISRINFIVYSKALDELLIKIVCCSIIIFFLLFLSSDKF